MRRAAPLVVKFGGATLTEPTKVLARIQRLREEGTPLVVVASARAGVTDLLRELLALPRASARHQVILDELERLHPDLPERGRSALRRLRRLLDDLARGGKAGPRRADRLLSQGERLAVHWLAGRLAEAGVPAVAVEADHLGLLTDNAYGASCILVDRCASTVRRGLDRILRTGRIPVVTGFFGRSLEGSVATLGRGGSDYSATAIGAILRASRVELVKREVSVLTADPRIVPAARPIRRLSYEEAEELAQFGATVLHPLTVEPARAVGLEVRVASLDEPDTGTTIGPPTGPNGVRALTLLAPLGLVRVRVPGGRQRPGVVAEVSKRLADSGINIVTLFTSSALLSVVLERNMARAGRRVLQAIADRDAAVVDGPFSVGLVTAIGDGVLHDLARLPPELLADGQGLSATPRSLSLAVPVPQARSALIALHRALVEEADR